MMFTVWLSLLILMRFKLGTIQKRLRLPNFVEGYDLHLNQVGVARQKKNTLSTINNFFASDTVIYILLEIMALMARLLP